MIIHSHDKLSQTVSQETHHSNECDHFIFIFCICPPGVDWSKSSSLFYSTDGNELCKCIALIRHFFVCDLDVFLFYQEPGWTEWQNMEQSSYFSHDWGRKTSLTLQEYSRSTSQGFGTSVIQAQSITIIINFLSVLKEFKVASCRI